MKVLWVVNFALPEVSESNTEPVPFGGWVGAMLGLTKNVPGLVICLAMKAPVQSLVSKSIDGVDLYWSPMNKKDRYDISTEDCDAVLDDFSPDVMHLEGTEQAHSLRFISSWSGKNVVSLQGIINGYEPYEYGGLNLASLLRTPSFRVIFFGLSMWANKRLFFRPRLAKERATLAKAQNFLGRTTWDKAHSYWRNPSANYYSCNRVLREEFYREKWSIDRKRQFCIFVGNAASPRKGFHFVLQALSILKADYPGIRVLVAGSMPFPTSVKDWKKIIGYPAYLRYLLKKLDLAEHVEFLGLLSSTDIAAQMCSAHVFVLPSLIENSPNTLGEAMAMGVPCVSAYSGGVPDMAVDGEEALFYRADDPWHMAFQIRRIFDDPQLARRLSISARAKAMRTHNQADNLERLLRAYEQIAGQRIQRTGAGDE